MRYFIAALIVGCSSPVAMPPADAATADTTWTCADNCGVICGAGDTVACGPWADCAHCIPRCRSLEAPFTRSAPPACEPGNEGFAVSPRHCGADSVVFCSEML
jgi:hypothetical protein